MFDWIKAKSSGKIDELVLMNIFSANEQKINSIELKSNIISTNEHIV